MLAQTLTTNSTYDFRLFAEQNGAPWDLTGATITLYLTDPAGNVTSHAASSSAPTTGIADYISLTTDLTSAGIWERSWRVQQGPTDITSAPISFRVAQAR